MLIFKGPISNLVCVQYLLHNNAMLMSVITRVMTKYFVLAHATGAGL